jgi:hypothetical protein
MAFSLYDASVANYLQILGAVAGYMDKAAAHFKEKGADLEQVVETRLFDDMLPFRFQIVSVAHHSQGAMEAVQKGVFSPNMGKPDLKYADLQKMVADATSSLTALKPDAVNAMAGGDVMFQFGERKMPFTAAEFLMSFSLPNFFFHATTAYDILRHKGAPLGKRDFMGKLRIKR